MTVVHLFKSKVFQLAIIVDKVQKRKDIALSCTELLLEKGIKKLTVAEVAKTAGVAKGSIYDYFQNKEDIVFEIIRNFIQDYHDSFMAKIGNENKTTREKVFLLFDFVLNEEAEFEKKHDVYKEYISINLSTDNEEMLKFNEECSDFFMNLLTAFIKEGIEKGELIKESKDLIKGLQASEKGFIFLKWTQKKEVKEDFKIFLNTLFNLLEVKNDR